MSDTLLRWELWILAAVLAFFILGDALEDSHLKEMVPLPSFVMKIAKFGGALIALGIVVKIFEKIRPPKKSRCRTCGRPVSKGAVYCATHLRQVVDEEDMRHRTLNVRRPDL